MARSMNTWLKMLCRGLAQFVMTEYGARGYQVSFPDLELGKTWTVEVRCVERARVPADAETMTAVPAGWLETTSRVPVGAGT